MTTENFNFYLVLCGRERSMPSFLACIAIRFNFDLPRSVIDTFRSGYALKLRPDGKLTGLSFCFEDMIGPG